MQKLMKSWVFTLIVCILLSTLTVFMFLDGFDVGGLHIASRLIHLVSAIALALYVIFVLFPLLVRYQGKMRAFALGEIVILALIALAHFCMEWVMIPLISSMAVCSVVGLALWLRGAVETVHAYLSALEEDPAKRIPLWRLLCYILLCGVGVWQLILPTVPDRSFIFVIASVCAVMAVIFAWMTATNRKESAPLRAAKKAERLARAQAAQKEEQESAEPPIQLPQESAQAAALLPENETKTENEKG